MNAPAWDRVKGLFQEALERPAAARAEWLRERCGGDCELLAEIEALLAAHDEADAFAELPAAAPLRLHPGDRLGVYEIEALLGAGGMGEVYKGRDTRLHRLVAIKILPPHLAVDPDRYERFQREARAVARLDHPHIGALYDLGTHASPESTQEVPYLVMQHLDGDTLAARVASGPLPIDQAVRIAIDIAEALDHAHRRGLIHRDVKPANIMLTKNGAILLDFGIAKWRPLGAVLAGSASGVRPTLPDTITEQGVIAGTLSYAAPEQLDGKAIDARADLFALGVVLYEMLTGRKPFDGDSPARVMAAVLHATPSVAGLRPDTPAALDRVVTACLAKDPDARWQSAGDLARQLRWILDAGATPLVDQRPAPTWTRRRAAFAAAASLLAGVLIGGTAAWSRSHQAPATSDASVIRSELSSAAGTIENVALSRDGTRLAYVAGGRVYLQRLAELEPTAIAENDACCPFFSPDGRWLGFVSADDKLKKVATSGGAPQTICECRGGAAGASWGDDDTIVFSARGGLNRVAAAGGAIQPLTTIGEHEKGHRFPQVLPGSRAALFTIMTSNQKAYDDAKIAVVSLATRERRVVLDGGTSARFLATGDLVYLRGATLVAQPFDLTRLEIAGPPAAGVAGIQMQNDGRALFAAADSGLLAYVRGTPREGRERLVWVDRHGTLEALADAPRAQAIVSPTLSPDGRRLVFTLVGANDHVWVYDLERRTMLRLTSEWNNSYPAWTPDGTRVVYMSDRTGMMNVYWQPSDGSGPPEPLVASPYWTETGSVSPDGTMLAFAQQSATAGRDIIWTLTLDASRRLRPFLDTPSSKTWTQVSPDGRWVAYVSDETGRLEVYVQSFPTGGVKRLISNDGGTRPRWGRDSRELFYQNRGKTMAVTIDSRSELAIGTPRELFSGPYGGYDVSRDGRFVMVHLGNPDAGSTHITLVQNWFTELQQRVPTR